jgi:hypothetical protein
MAGDHLMIGLGPFALLSVAVFFCAFVSGLAGFALSAAAGAILLHMFKPLEAVPLMMACSVGVQAANLWALRESIRWKPCANARRAAWRADSVQAPKMPAAAD